MPFLSTKHPIPIAAVALAAFLIYFFWPDNLITLNFKNTPLKKIIESVERQGHIKILTNVALDTPVTIQMKKVSLMDAMETLSVRVDGNLRVAVSVAPTQAAANAVFEDLKSGKNPEGWTVSWYPSMDMGSDAAPCDPRFLQLQIESTEKNGLPALLSQISQKSGLMTAVPKDWNPTPALPKKPASADAILKQLAKSSRGSLQEHFLILGGEDRSPGGEREGRNSQGNNFQRNGLDARNPAWIAQRVEATITQLPSDSQKAARADFDAMKKTWEEIRSLPQEQRREKMAEIFERPEVQERMAAREAARDARRTPEQRERRMKNYIERKKQIQAGQSAPARS